MTKIYPGGYERLFLTLHTSKDTEVGRHFILQGIFPTQGLNQGFMHYGQILYHLSHQGSYIALNVCVYYKNREPKN